MRMPTMRKAITREQFTGNSRAIHGDRLSVTMSPEFQSMADKSVRPGSHPTPPPRKCLTRESPPIPPSRRRASPSLSRSARHPLSPRRFWRGRRGRRGSGRFDRSQKAPLRAGCRPFAICGHATSKNPGGDIIPFHLRSGARNRGGRKTTPSPPAPAHGRQGQASQQED